MKKFAQQVAALLILAGLIYLGVRLVVAGVRTFQGLDRQVAAALVAGFASVTVATASIVGNRVLERRAQTERALREKKTAIYEHFISGMFDFFDLRPGKRTEAEKTERLQAFFADLTPQLIAWADDDVIVAWSRFRQQSVAEGAEPGIEVMLVFENVLRAVRKDLGHRGRRVKPGDLLSLFVTDIANYLPSSGSRT